MPHLSRMTSGPPVLPPVPEIDYELSFDQYGSIRSQSSRRRDSAIYAPKPVKAFSPASFLQHPPPPPPLPEDVPEDFSDEEGESEEEHPSTGGVLHSTLDDYCSPTSPTHSRSPCSPDSAHSIAKSPSRSTSFADSACQVTEPLWLSKRTPTPESAPAITDLIASSSHYRNAPFNVPRSPSPTLASEEVLPVFMRSIVRRQMVEGPLPASVEEAVDKELERLKAKALRGIDGAQAVSPRISNGITIESLLKNDAAPRTPTTEAKGRPDCVCKHCHKHGTPPLSAKPPAFALGALPPTPQAKQQPHIAAISIRRPASDEPRPSPTLPSPRPVSEQLSKENIVLPVPEHPYASRSAQQHLSLHSPVEQQLALKSPIQLASEPAPASPVPFSVTPLSAAPLPAALSSAPVYAAPPSPGLSSPLGFVSSPTVNAYGIVTPYTLPGKPPKRPPRPAESLHIPSRPQTPQHTHVIVALPEGSRKNKEHVRRTSEPDSASSLGSFKDAIMDRTKTLAKQHTRKQSHEDAVPPTTNSKAIAILGGGSAANRRSTDPTSPSVSSASSKTSFFSRKSSISELSPQIKSSKAAALLGIGAPEPPKRRFWENSKKADINEETDRYYTRGGSLSRVGRRTQPTGWSGAEGATDRTSHYERGTTPETDTSDDEIYLSTTPPPPASTGVTTIQTVRIEPGPGDRFAPLSATIDVPEDVDPDYALAERTKDKGKAKAEIPALFPLEPLESHPFRPKQLQPKIRQEPQPSPSHVEPKPAATPVAMLDTPLSPGSANEPPPRSSSFAASEIIAAIPPSCKSPRSDEPMRAPKVDSVQAVRREEDALYTMAIPISALKRSEGNKLRPAPITVEHVPPKRPYPVVVQEEALSPLAVPKAATPPPPPSPSLKEEARRDEADAPISALTAAVPATAVPPSAPLPPPPLPPAPPPPPVQEEQVSSRPKRRLKSEIISKFRMIDPPVELPSSSQPAQPSNQEETCTDATGYTDTTATSTDCSTPVDSAQNSASSPLSSSSSTSTSPSTSTSTSSSSCDSFGTVTGSPVSPGATATNATRVTLDSSRASYVENHKIVARNNAQPRLIIAERHIPDLSRRTQDLWEQIRDDDDDADDETDSSSSSSDDEDDAMEPLPHLPPLEEAIRIHTPRPRAGSAASSSATASPSNSLGLPGSTNTSPSQAGAAPGPNTPSPSTLARTDSQRSNSPWRYTPLFDKDGREIPNLTPSTAQVRARAEYNARMNMQQESWFEPATPSTPTMPSMGDKVKAKVGAGSRWIKGHVQTLSR